MKKFLLPLGLFVFGMILLACSTIFYPAIGDAASSLQAETSEIASYYWGWNWAVSSTRLIIFITGLFVVVLSVGIAWWQRR